MEGLGLRWRGTAEVAGVGAEPECSYLFSYNTFHNCVF